MRTITWRVAALCAAALITACGGGNDNDPGAALPASGTAKAGAPLAAMAALPLAATVAQVTPDQLMDWAEQQYTMFFPTAGRQAGVFGEYTYRFYPGSQNYIGITASGGVFIYGNISGWQITQVGTLAQYTCTVAPQNCSAPGAPTIGTATAGNASASISFTAPSSSGGSAVTQYNATCTAASALLAVGTATVSPITVGSLVNGTAYSCSVSATNSFGTGPASGSVSVTPSASTNTGTTTSTTTTTGGVTSGVYCGYSASVYNSSTSVRATSTVSITCGSTARTLTGNGIPDHTTGTFPNTNNPSAIASQTVNVTMTMAPLAKTTSTPATIIGYVLNSVKMDPNTNATCTVSGTTVTCEADDSDHSGQWNIEAMGQTTMNLGLDTNNAHVQPGGAYHYHGMPEGFITRLNKGQAMTLIGFALDGFPVYARYGYTTATDATSAIKVMTGSYRKKTTADSGRPSTSTYPMGTFKQDYEYVAGLGDLDACNGRYGVTPEFPNGIYHYYATDTYPFLPRCLYGSFTPSTGGTTGGTGGTGGTTQPPPPGGGTGGTGTPPPPQPRPARQ